MSRIICKAECRYNTGKDSCMNAEVIIRPLSMPTEAGDGEIIIGFVCGMGTEALYEEMNHEEDITEESL